MKFLRFLCNLRRDSLVFDEKQRTEDFLSLSDVDKQKKSEKILALEPNEDIFFDFLSRKRRFRHGYGARKSKID